MGSSSKYWSTFWGFRGMAQCCKLKEISFWGNMFSLAGKKDIVWVQCRLDRSFGNDEWLNLFSQSHLQYDDMWASDHKPFLIRFAYENENQYKKRFYFDKRMANEEGFEELIQQSCCGDTEDDACTVARISRCSCDISKWKRQMVSTPKIK